MSGYAFHPDAFADLDEIWEYIAQDNVDAADRVLADIHSTLTLLAGSPQIGHRRPDLTTRPLRFHVVREYLMAYAPDEKPLGSWRCFTAVEIPDSSRPFFAAENRF
jgi:plasmid stabilization system protein ParE